MNTYGIVHTAKGDVSLGDDLRWHSKNPIIAENANYIVRESDFHPGEAVPSQMLCRLAKVASGRVVRHQTGVQ